MAANSKTDKSSAKLCRSASKLRNNMDAAECKHVVLGVIFLNDNAKPWSKRCDFVVFHRVREHSNVHCFEFKSATFPDALGDQLEASEAWCRALRSSIKHYTGDAKPLYLTKFVLSCHPNPTPYLDAAGKYLQRDHSIRHYIYQDIDGLSLDALDNTNVESII